VAGGWRKLHNAKFHNLYSAPNIIRATEPRRMRWAGHVAHMGYEKCIQILARKHEEQDEDGRIMLKQISE